jgi:hypothetical protein
LSRMHLANPNAASSSDGSLVAGAVALTAPTVPNAAPTVANPAVAAANIAAIRELLISDPPR